jgi:hypothetical protein
VPLCLRIAVVLLYRKAQGGREGAQMGDLAGRIENRRRRPGR